MAKLKKQTGNLKCGQGCWATRTLTCCWQESLENNLAVSYKVKFTPNIWPSDSSPGYHT